MGKDNSFRDSLQVDSETMAKLDSVSKYYCSKKSSKSKRENSFGRERGDESLGRQGREPGYKSGNNPRACAVKNASSKASNGSSSGRRAAVTDSVTSANRNRLGASTAGQSDGADWGFGSATSAGNASSGHGQGK